VSGGARPGGDRSDEAAALVGQRSSVRPLVAVVLGSGLGAAIGPDVLAPDASFAYGDLPGFPPPAVPGHAARLTLGALFGVPAAVFAGRVHLYEGHGVAGPTLIPRLAHALGARLMVLTNAAGGLDPDMHAGDLMLLTDHVNLMGANPLTGWTFADGTPAFVDLTSVYDPALRARALAVADREGIGLRSGVYAVVRDAGRARDGANAGRERRRDVHGPGGRRRRGAGHADARDLLHHERGGPANEPRGGPGRRHRRVGEARATAGRYPWGSFG
jgi:purine nucleoside phosphorylase